MQDMRYLYGMPKTASTRHDEFVGRLRSYLGSLRLDGMPVKTASEKRAVVVDLLSKYAADCGKANLPVNVVKQCNGSVGGIKNHNVENRK